MQVSVVQFRPWAPSCFALRASQDCTTQNRETGCPPEPWRRRAAGMRYVYLLQSEAFAGQRYIGITSDLRKRLAEHNGGRSPHTSKYSPWKLVTYVAFS